MAEILVTENIIGEPMTELRRIRDVAFEPDLWRSPDRLSADVLRNTRALIVRNQTPVTSSLIAAASRLEIVARAGVGLDNIDVAAASAAGVVVTYTPQANAVSVAELAIGLMLALARKIPAADRDTKAGGWDRQRFTGIELAGRRLGLVGFGRIGRMTAERAKAFGMSLATYDPIADRNDPDLQRWDVQLQTLDEVLSTADIISCHVPLTSGTTGLFNAESFARMKQGSIFVNTARGEIVDEAALLHALQTGHLSGAALDVRGTEPPGSTSFDDLDNVILTPHVGAFTAEAQYRTLEAVCRDVTAVLAGEAAGEFVNFPRPRRGTPE